MLESSTILKEPLYDPKSKIKNFVQDQDFDSINLTATRDGILYTEANPLQNPGINMEWKRPKEICDNPCFINGKPNRFDALQGILGDCWVAVAIESLTLNEQLIKHVVPPDQSFDHNYTGAFHFRIWQLGVWYDVVVDDRLPVFMNTKKLCFVHSKYGNVFWAALLEKAYSKTCNRLYTDYQSLKSGSATVSFQDFTGGIPEVIKPKSPPLGRPFKWFLNEVISNRALASCSIRFANKKELIQTTNLIPGHAYLISGVFRAKDDDPDYHGLFLIRIMNPWGKREWSGEWSDDNFDMWKQIDKGVRKAMGFKAEPDGEFWMSEDDFKKYFQELRVCHLGPGQYLYTHFHYQVGTWSTTAFHGDWIKGLSAGGSQQDKLHINPQYKIKLTTPEDTVDGLVKVVIELTQKSLLKTNFFGIVTGCGVAANNVGFYVYFLKNENDKQNTLNQDFFDTTTTQNKPDYPMIPERSYVTSLNLAPGWYCIVPFTQFADREAKFLLRVFAESNVEHWEYDQRVSKSLHIEVSPSEILINEELTYLFNESSQNGEVDWIGLKNILEKGMNPTPASVFKRFSNSTAKGPLKNYSTEFKDSYTVFSKGECRRMIEMLDQDNSGKLNYNEFCSLWKKIQFWYRVFGSFRDSEGCFKVEKLRDALSSIGFALNKQVIHRVVHFYGNDQGQINLTDFILCGVIFETFFTRYESYKINECLNLTLEEWVKITLTV